MALFFAPMANIVLSAVRPSEEGQASGANNAIRELGGVFGVAVLAAVFSHVGGYEIGAGVHRRDEHRGARRRGASSAFGAHRRIRDARPARARARRPSSSRARAARRRPRDAFVSPDRAVSDTCRRRLRHERPPQSTRASMRPCRPRRQAERCSELVLVLPAERCRRASRSSSLSQRCLADRRLGEGLRVTYECSNVPSRQKRRSMRDPDGSESRRRVSSTARASIAVASSRVVVPR